MMDIAKKANAQQSNAPLGRELHFRFLPEAHTRYRTDLDWRQSANLDSYIPVSFHFAADPVRRLVRLKVSNFVDLGATAYLLQPEWIKTPLLDELARYILRRPSRFSELTGNVVPEPIRTRLRSKIDETRRERATASA